MSALWSSLAAYVASEFPQVRPNLEASVIWVPIAIAGSAAVHHILLLLHLRGVHRRIDDVHARIDTTRQPP